MEEENSFATLSTVYGPLCLENKIPHTIKERKPNNINKKCMNNTLNDRFMCNKNTVYGASLRFLKCFVA